MGVHPQGLDFDPTTDSTRAYGAPVRTQRWDETVSGLRPPAVERIRQR